MMAISSSNTRLLATALSSRFFAPAYSALACRRHSTITGIASPYTCSSPGPGSWVTNSRCSLHAGFTTGCSTAAMAYSTDPVQYLVREQGELAMWMKIYYDLK